MVEREQAGARAISDEAKLESDPCSSSKGRVRTGARASHPAKVSVGTTSLVRDSISLILEEFLQPGFELLYLLLALLPQRLLTFRQFRAHLS